jgi:hypothetical protein
MAVYVDIGASSCTGNFTGEGGCKDVSLRASQRAKVSVTIATKVFTIEW